MKFTWRWVYFLLLLLVAEFVIFGSINPRFLNIHVILMSMNDFMPVCLVSLFVTLVIVTGGIDIQAGSVIGLTSVCMGVFWQKLGLDIFVAALLGLIVAGACGLISGWLISRTDVQPMVITLGGSFLFSGVALVVPSLAGVSAYQGITNFPQVFQSIGNGSVGVIPNQVILFAVLVAVAWLLLHRSKYGRKVFLIGVNRRTAEYSGIKSANIIMIAYVLSGLSAGVAGIVMTSYLGTAKPDFGSDLTLPIITAVVLGGTSIYGGKGSVIGTALASLVIGLLKFGLSLMGTPTQYQNIPVGVLLILALMVNFVVSKGIFKDLRKRLARKGAKLDLVEA